MKISNIIKLKKCIQKYDILIFDLDDTIYNQYRYDNPALKNVSRFLSKTLKLSSEKIFLDLRKLKKIKRGKHPLLVFDRYLKKKIFDEKKLNIIIRKSVKIFQSYNCNDLKNAPSLRNLFNSIRKKKTLFLVTNGNYERQKRKIKNLKINRYFKKIFILDGIKKKIKPSTDNVNYLLNFIKKRPKKNAVFVGDNKKSDKLFADNLKIDFIYFEFPD